MVISTSSHNLRLTEDVCEHVESVLRNEFVHVAEHVVSVDARLESVHDSRDCSNVKAVVRVDLGNHRSVVAETQDDSLATAVQRSAIDSARAVDRQLQHFTRPTDQRFPAKFHAFGRFPAPNV